MSERIYMSSPDITPLEHQYVQRALESGWVAPLGPEVDAFEAEVAQRTNREYAVALSSGTAALHLGLLALGVKPGDVVPTASMTFAATANAIKYVGATPYFIDCDPKTGNIDTDLLAQVLEELTQQGRTIGAIVPVDLLGKVADYPTIEKLAHKYGVPVLADAAESFGAALACDAETDTGQTILPAGSFGEAAILSFNGNKIMTTSGGGMFLTDDKDLADKVRYLATQARQPVAHYEHQDIGYNYRLSNVLAALGRAQLTRLDEMIGSRRAMRGKYQQLFADVPGVTVFQAEDSQSNTDTYDNCWLTAILIDPEEASFTPGELSAALATKNIETRPLWKPMHLQPVFQGEPAKTSGTSETLFQTGLTLPSGSGLTGSQEGTVFTAITEFLGIEGGM